MQENLRKIIIKFFLGMSAFILIGKAFQLQILDTSYQNRASAMLFQKSTLYPSRGLIIDRNDQLLVNNNPIYDIMVTYNQVDPEMDRAKFCKLLDIDLKEFNTALEKDWSSVKFSKSIPFVFLNKIQAVKLARFEESLYEFPGFFIQLRNYRSYPINNGANIIGYISEVNNRQIEKSSDIYHKGDYIGSSGLESFYEDLLRGNKGAEYVIKDNVGRIVGRYKNGELDSAAISGLDLTTSLDIDLQKYGEELMANKLGSIVAIEPGSGEILAMISSPNFDPNLLSINQSRGKAYDSLQQSPLRPLFNRPVMAKYPPGSIYKCIMGLIALEDGLINQNRYIYCKGGYWYNDDFRKCHDHPSPVNISSAIQHSCNTYFFEIFREIIDQHGPRSPQIGLNAMNRNLYSFGLGRQLGIDMPSESSGNIPTPDYYNKIYPKRKGGWKSPTIMSLGIGQGELELTPLQIANLAATIANEGYYYTPHFITEINGVAQNEFKAKNQTFVKKEHFTPIKKGMKKVVEAGTGWNAYIPGIAVCGKTGTSQNPHGEDHSVFFAFAPMDDPQIAIAVLVENAGDGNGFAAPIVGLMIEKYLKDEISPYKKSLERRMLNAVLTNP